ncbi:MAG: hypothetical protein PHR25_03780 [Clostridia bacterium]|nr:hypothetical protein [Clostridia bacterium]MDD4375882.1 hypothetical protein [Clostridia bacterium]
MINKKRGLTLLSIVIYVTLFFAFSSITIMISSRTNKNLFEDRGNAINISNINKLEYNLLESSNKSNNVLIQKTPIEEKIIFSNNDEYRYNKEDRIIYKNNGKLIKNVTNFEVNGTAGYIDINLKFNKYTNITERNIKIGIKTS